MPLSVTSAVLLILTAHLRLGKKKGNKKYLGQSVKKWLKTFGIEEMYGRHTKFRLVHTESNVTVSEVLYA